MTPGICTKDATADDLASRPAGHGIVLHPGFRTLKPLDQNAPAMKHVRTNLVLNAIESWFDDGLSPVEAKRIRPLAGKHRTSENNEDFPG